MFDNKVVAYLVLTAVMVVTFICAIAINTDTYSIVAWLILLAINIGLLVFISKTEK